MSLFGERLRALIDANKVNIYALAKSSGIERTAIHKIISGDRIPSEEYANKLAEILPLSPEERQQLLESFNISKVGEFKYRQRLQVKDIIESISYIENAVSVNISSVRAINSPPLLDANTTAIGHFAVNNLIKSVIEETISTAGNQEIDFVISENYKYFYDELLANYLRHPQLQIRHIVAFTKQTDFLNNSNRNLSLLSHVLPFAFAPGTAYFPYYYYGVSYSSELTQAMPYFILTSQDRLVLVNKDFNKAVYISDTDIVALYRESFNVMLEQSKPLIKRLNSTFDFIIHINEIGSPDDTQFYWIEPEPCISLIITDEIISEYLRHDVPDRENMHSLLRSHCEHFRNSHFQIINACTTEGLYRVINSGYVYNIPSELMTPFSRETMKKLLEILINKSKDETGNVKLRFVNPSKISVPKKTFIGISKKTGVNLIMHSKALTAGRAICILEDSIDEAFWDFAESLEDSAITYNADDSLTMLSSIIYEL